MINKYLGVKAGVFHPQFMDNDMKNEWRKAVWTIVAAAVIALATSFAQTWSAQKSMSHQIEVLKEEQDLIRTKVDLLQIEMQHKVNRKTMDDCLTGMRDDISETKDLMIQLYRELKSN